MDTTHHELLARVASMYYDEEKSQDQIGKELGLSRVKVYRLLKEAKESGVVQILIHWPVQRNTQLEQALIDCFGLKEALVLNKNGTASSHVLREIGRLGAQYLEGALVDGCTLAVCLGQSTYEVVNAIRPRYQLHVRVAQAVGSIPFTMQEFDSATIGRQLAQKLGGEVLYLSSPLMADSPEAADVIRRQQHVRATLEAARKADVALVGIGNLDPQRSRLVEAGFFSADDMRELAARGAVGDMAGQIFSIDGKPHPTQHNKRIIGITLDELARIPTTIAVAAGGEKARAILGALRTGAFNVLCTDDESAANALRMEDDTIQREVMSHSTT
jgi:DNA-binding transcriptional regulator LsrR (DeoR family)